MLTAPQIRADTFAAACAGFSYMHEIVTKYHKDPHFLSDGCAQPQISNKL